MSKKSTFWADFKKFITKGNVVDMAVGVVIGGSFGKIVTGLVNYVINPFVGIFVKSGDLDSIKTIITAEVKDATGVVTTPEVAILWGTWIQTIIDFLITAFCIFAVLRIIMRTQNILNAKEIEKAEAEAAKKKAEEEAARQQLEEEAKALAERKLALEEATLETKVLLEEIKEILKKK